MHKTNAHDAVGVIPVTLYYPSPAQAGSPTALVYKIFHINFVVIITEHPGTYFFVPPPFRVAIRRNQ